MKPYPVLNRRQSPRAVLLQCLLGAFVVITLISSASGLLFPTLSLPTGPYRADQDPQVKAALDDFYNLDYDKAISQFERIRKTHSDDPFAIVHVLQAVVFRELYHLNLLDTTLYAHDGFLTGRATQSDPAVRAKVDQLTAQALEVCNARLV